MSKQSDTIDRVLEKIINYGICIGERSPNLDGYSSEEEAKAALSAMVAEIIGEESAYSDMCEVCSGWDDGRNDLQAEQRQRATALGFDVSERRG